MIPECEKHPGFPLMPGRSGLCQRCWQDAWHSADVPAPEQGRNPAHDRYLRSQGRKRG
jgi:hypothetical protein